MIHYLLYITTCIRFNTPSRQIISQTVAYDLQVMTGHDARRQCYTKRRCQPSCSSNKLSRRNSTQTNTRQPQHQLVTDRRNGIYLQRRLRHRTTPLLATPTH